MRTLEEENEILRTEILKRRTTPSDLILQGVGALA